MQSIAAVAESLGRTRREGQYLASLHWDYGYSRNADSKYVSVECRDRGELDLRPDTAVWP